MLDQQPPEGGAAAFALPTYFELKAPAQWRVIDFISDLHLCAAMPRTFAAFVNHLQRTPADAVIVLGDLFELWVGDDMGQQGFESACLDEIAQASTHRQLAFMVGNRDFLAGQTMLRTSGMQGLPDPTVLVAWGRRILLTHGDALCLADKPYQQFRKLVRASAWQSEFLAKSLPERLQIATDIRQASAGRQQFDGAAEVDIESSLAVHWMHGFGTQEMVHGHTHRPGSETLAPGYKRHVLSDWDLDKATRAQVLRLTRNGFARVAPAAP